MCNKYHFNGEYVKRKGQKLKGKCSLEIGVIDANINTEMLKDKDLQKILTKLGGKLIEQLKCDGINFTGFSFQRLWIEKK